MKKVIDSLQLAEKYLQVELDTNPSSVVCQNASNEITFAINHLNTPKRNYLVFVKMSTGYCGESSTEVITTDSLDLSDLDGTVDEMAKENAERYGHYGSYYCQDCNCESEDPTCVDCGSDNTQWEEYDRAEGSSEFYKPKDHDCLRCGSGPFLDEYPTALQDSEGRWFEPVLEGDAADIVAKLLGRMEAAEQEASFVKSENRQLRSTVKRIKELVG